LRQIVISIDIDQVAADEYVGDRLAACREVIGAPGFNFV
jgi:hypothetical protein